MLPFAINHMTVPNLGYRELFDLANTLNCIGVELRNGLARPLFDGDEAASVRDAALQRGIRIIGLSQVYPSNSWSDAIRDEVRVLIGRALRDTIQHMETSAAAANA